MFEIFCPAHGSPVLLTTRHIEALHSTPDGVIIDWRCWCGELGTLPMRTSRAARRRPLVLAKAS